MFLWCLFRLFKWLSISLCISNVYFNSWEEEKRNLLTLQFIKLDLSRVCSKLKQQQMEQSIITQGHLWKCERISHYITQKISSECSRKSVWTSTYFLKLQSGEGVVFVEWKGKGIEEYMELKAKKTAFKQVEGNEKHKFFLWLTVKCELTLCMCSWWKHTAARSFVWYVLAHSSLFTSVFTWSEKRDVKTWKNVTFLNMYRAITSDKQS